MSKKLMMPLVLAAVMMALGLPLWAAEMDSEAVAPVVIAPQSAADTDEIKAGACSEAAAVPTKIKNDLFNPDGTPVGAFCNVTGFANCETLNGTACSVVGLTQRCYFNPPRYCEWSNCRCNGTSWKCFGVE